ncbi:MAG: endonuclease MutS2 [Bacteroidetes bacterium]|nr:endonuclease MutS2 [Bacteroidota bacterium]
MIYPKDFEQKTGFDSIREKLKNNCLCSLGESYVDKIRFNKDFDLIDKLLTQVHEFTEILQFSDNFPSQDYYDLTDELSRIRIEGTILELEALFDLRSSLITIVDILDFFKKSEAEKYFELKVLVESVVLDKSILEKISVIVDAKGKIKDGASKKLKEIRSDLIKKQSQIDRKINQSLKQVKSEGWAASDVEPTLRNNRLVIPVLAAHKRKLKGFIHDESSTGQTVYIEPTEVFDTNNEIRELENAEKREITRILIEFTNFLRPQLEDIKSAYRFMGLIDFIRAKAKFAIEIRAQKPVLLDKQIINWVDTRHPLLFISHKAQKREVIPLNLQLNNAQRILIISGPNAGGKSVCLKTVGLTQSMIQCGLLPALDESSEAGIFESIFIDIGDEQSLENDLSTYSSHLLNIKFFTLNCNAKTLFLIDEFGTGTEPQLGGAIAEAALERLNENEAFGVITTHYSNLKLLADTQAGIVNGAMLFDTVNMQPLYQLKIGNPGSSFAFEIARNIGFPKIVLKRAENKTGKNQLNFDQQLQQLEVEKLALNKKQEEFNVADSFLTELVTKYEGLVKEVEDTKQNILTTAKNEALELLNSSNKLIENTIKEIKEAQADKEKTKAARKRIRQTSDAIKKKEVKTNISIAKAKPAEDKVEKSFAIDSLIAEGDFVQIKDQDTIGEVVDIHGDEAVISFNSIKFRTPIEKLRKVSEKQAKQEAKLTKRSGYSAIINELNDKMTKFSLSIDLRGKRADEALSDIRRYVDEAILLSIKEVNILHGKGDGILRKISREYLDTIDQVENYQDQKPDRGGDGITVVTFK